MGCPLHRFLRLDPRWDEGELMRIDEPDWVAVIVSGDDAFSAELRVPYKPSIELEP